MSLLIDRFGRKPLMLFGALGCGVCFTLVTVGLAIDSKPSLAMSVSFIFGYHLFYVSLFSYVSGPQSDKSCILGRIVPLHTILISLGDKLLSHAQHRQLYRYGSELAVCLCGSVNHTKW